MNTATNDATRDTTGRDSDATPMRQSATIGDAAKALGVSVRTIQRRIERGQMSATERDGKRFVELPSHSATVATPMRQGATVDATPRQSDATERDSDAERIAELKAEVLFLRGLVEQRDRDGAELRAALREALKLAPKQLQAGTQPPQAAQSATANNVPSATPASAQRPAKRDGAALSYGDIADELEQNMRK
jgi:excisionase family DNA binding protein